jgi:hypothetical protein
VPDPLARPHLLNVSASRSSALPIQKLFEQVTSEFVNAQPLERQKYARQSLYAFSRRLVDVVENGGLGPSQDEIARSVYCSYWRGVYANNRERILARRRELRRARRQKGK